MKSNRKLVRWVVAVAMPAWLTLFESTANVAAQPVPTVTPDIPSTSPATRPSIEAEVRRLRTKFEGRLRAARYMERGTSATVTYPGYEGFPLIRWTYTVRDKDTATSDEMATVKTADVIMLNPDAERLSRWIVSACVEVRRGIDPGFADRLFQHVLSQSGGQFPVAGIVYEDILPADGINEIFCFRDGVTVQIQGVKHRGTVQPTPEEIERSLYGKVERVFRYARVASTSPGQYKRAGGTRDVGSDTTRTLEWLSVSRENHLKAMRENSNFLLTARAKEPLH